MLVDISKITLENLYMYEPSYNKNKRKKRTQKEYQHEYYLRVTKPKRINKIKEKNNDRGRKESC